MDVPSFYRSLSAELFQGDIFERLPLVYLKESPRSLKKTTIPGNRDGFEVGELVSASASAPWLVPAPCDNTRAMLLTYDCEIDKASTKLLTVALVRPLDPGMADGDKAALRDNRKFAFFHLQSWGPDAPESYVDFRRLSSLGIETVKIAARNSRLSVTARKAMMFQFFRYFTRIDLHRAVIPELAQE
jgi:hypothetical protein